MIRVETYDPITEESVGEKVINYNDREDRNWYISNFIWAMTNGKSVDTTPMSIPLEVIKKRHEDVG